MLLENNMNDNRFCKHYLLKELKYIHLSSSNHLKKLSVYISCLLKQFIFRGRKKDKQTIKIPFLKKFHFPVILFLSI